MTCHCAHDHRLVNGKDCSSDPRCPEGTKPCLSEDICLPLEQFCNGVADCPDHSDENCEESQNPTFWLTYLKHLREEKVSFTNNVHYADAGEHFCSMNLMSVNLMSHFTLKSKEKNRKLNFFIMQIILMDLKIYITLFWDTFLKITFLWWLSISLLFVHFYGFNSIIVYIIMRTVK